ncbi:hypothetical protein [[Mycobacterium] nativiensis]|uniref:Uncharacterized protein n=1 Tax=[Mycobacterium] nativiensis TaxID=2855503 RepID=A0ABU5XQJ2_9MYCO|nr:hypothetical protein [Mycolicibacter sp. MYC340]MEB3030254.1 hypothetical protein [Mycolicibacter sp. MYC340]
MTNRRVQAAAVAAAAGGGLLTAAFLQVAVAAADSGTDAFTIGGLTFDDPVALPGLLGGEPTPGWESLSPLFSNTPVLSLGSDLALGLLNFGTQQLTVTDGSGTTLGTVDAHTAIQDLLGIETAQFTVASNDPASGLTDTQAAELPTEGTVYSVTKIGNGFYNVYEAVPNAAGTASSSISDTVVTPFGNFNLPTTFDAIAPLNPATPLEALGNTSGATGLSDNAFTIGSTTFDPGSDGITVAAPISLANFAPLMDLEAGALNITGGGPAETQAEQNFEVYNNGTDDGSVQTFLWYSNLLGFHNTEFTVGGATPNSGDAADLPTVGTVYSVTDLGSGYENVYEAAPAASGTGPSTITDTLVTPFGDFNMPTTFDAAAPMDPAAPLGALTAASGNAALSDHAFTIGGTTFDPGTAGFSTDNTYPLFSIAPLLEITGANALGLSFETQSGVEVYDSSGAGLGTVDLGENLSNILGIDTTQFTVSNAAAASGLTAAQTAELPTDGTVYSITDLGSFTNVYEAIPNADGTAASSITDTLITPFGNIDLSSMFSMFDAIAPLNAGDVVSGLDVGGAAAGFDFFDPSTWF